MHAWPELYFASYGWVRFEPTPASVTGTAPAWTVPGGPPGDRRPSRQPSSGVDRVRGADAPDRLPPTPGPARHGWGKTLIGPGSACWCC